MKWSIETKNKIIVEDLGTELLKCAHDSNVIIDYHSGLFYPFENKFFGDLYNSFFIYPSIHFGTKIGTLRGQKLLFSLSISMIKIMKRPTTNSFQILIEHLAKRGQNS